MPDIDKVIAALDARPAGRDRWRAACPGHGGTNPTALLIRDNGHKISAHCFAHDCSIQSIADGAGLSVGDFLPDCEMVRASVPPLTEEECWWLKIAVADRAAGRQLSQSEKEKEIRLSLKARRRAEHLLSLMGKEL